MMMTNHAMIDLAALQLCKVMYPCICLHSHVSRGLRNDAAYQSRFTRV